jgi:hypothetical protein
MHVHSIVRSILAAPLEKKRRNISREVGLRDFEILRSKYVNFIKTKLKKRDISLEDTKLSFIVEFQHHLRAGAKISHNTAIKYAKDLKQILKYAVTLECIMVSPFANFKCSYKNAKSRIRNSRITLQLTIPLYFQIIFAT